MNIFSFSVQSPLFSFLFLVLVLVVFTYNLLSLFLYFDQIYDKQGRAN